MDERFPTGLEIKTGVEENKDRIQRPEKDPYMSELQDTADRLSEINRILSKKLVEMEGIVLKDRNFELDIQAGEQSEQVVLRSKEGSVKNFEDYLPHGYKFKSGAEFICDKKKKEIYFPKDKAASIFFLLTLFHEIGHAHESGNHPVSTWERFKAYGEATLKQLKSLKIKRETRLWDGKKETRITSLSYPAIIPEWYLDKLFENATRSERNAWAFSLRALRGLGKEGYYIFSEVDSPGRMRAFIDLCLFSYETHRIAQKSLAALESVDRRAIKRDKPYFLSGKSVNEFLDNFSKEIAGEDN